MRALMVICAAVLAVGRPVIASAQDAPTRCSDISDDKARLACYDEVAGRPSRGNQAAAQPEPEPATVTTKEIVAPIAPADYKTADPSDLHVAPNKFRNKPIELRRVHCYYADVNDYRCIAPGYQAVAVFSKDVDPPEAKTKLENDCGTMKAMSTSLCERTLHFVFSEGNEDMVDAMTNRVILRPTVVTVVNSTVAKKRK